MAAIDSFDPPVKNVACRVTLFLLNGSGQPVAPAGALVGKISIDNAAAATTTNTPVAVGSSMPGQIYVDLTAAETNGSVIALTITDGTYTASYVRPTDRYVAPASGAQPKDFRSRLFWLFAGRFNYSAATASSVSLTDGPTNSATVIGSSSVVLTDTGGYASGVTGA